MAQYGRTDELAQADGHVAAYVMTRCYGDDTPLYGPRRLAQMPSCHDQRVSKSHAAPRRPGGGRR